VAVINNLKRFEQPITLLKQMGPACGTTSLAMALNALGVASSSLTPQQLDSSHRPTWGFTSPELIIDLAKTHNLQAWPENRLDFLKIKEHLLAGRLLLALGVSKGKEPEPFKWHWQLIHGYEVMEDGRQFLLITDPNGWQKPILWDEYQSSFFKKLNFLGLPSRAEQFAIVVEKFAGENQLVHPRCFPKALQTVNLWGRCLKAFA
jgi:hypothetical protein